MTILVDMDDVICNFVQCVCEYHKSHGSSNVSLSDIHTWDLAEVFGMPLKQVFYMTHTAEFWDAMTPRHDAMIYLKRLHDEGNEVYIVTAAHYSTLYYRYELFIKKYFPWIDWGHFIVTHNKQLLQGDVLIDDYQGNLIGGKYSKILMSAAHNMRYETPGDIRRANNWQDVYRYLRGE